MASSTGTGIFSKPIPVLLLDGGLGTTLEDDHAIKFSSSTPLWSSHLLISSPETLLKVQSDFARAGADIILTATYQASLSGFRKTILDGGEPVREEDAKRYMLSSIQLARNAIASSRPGQQGFVALSLGAYGATMSPSTEYSGKYGSSISEADLVDFHQERLNLFVSDETAWAGVDIVAFETLPRLDEVQAVRQVMRKAPAKPYWITCVFPSPDADSLPDGSNIAQVVTAMLKGDRPPDAIGLNCTKIGKVRNLILQFEEAVTQQGHHFPHLVIYPDGAGNQVYDTQTQQWVTQTIQTPAAGAKVRFWSEDMLGIIQDVQQRKKWKSIIAGGCCKTSPSMIKDLRTSLSLATQDTLPGEIEDEPI